MQRLRPFHIEHCLSISHILGELYGFPLQTIQEQVLIIAKVSRVRSGDSYTVSRQVFVSYSEDGTRTRQYAHVGKVSIFHPLSYFSFKLLS